MSEILVIVPAEWVRQDIDYISSLTGYNIESMITLQNTKSLGDFNDRLFEAGYFAPGKFALDNMRVADVLVLDVNVYFKFGEV
jgi:hypothetical protein